MKFNLLRTKSTSNQGFMVNKNHPLVLIGREIICDILDIIQVLGF